MHRTNAKVTRVIQIQSRFEKKFTYGQTVTRSKEL
jgi:hypothetical protein